MPPASVKSCLDVLRRTDPRDAETHLARLANLVSSDDVADELYQRVDVPLKVAEDGEADGRKYLLCDHNRDGDSHRSPWSNAYFPPLDADGGAPPHRPSPRLRSLEQRANEAFDAYRELYHGRGPGSASSVYLWDGGGGDAAAPEGGGFAGCFLAQSRAGGGRWSAVHVVDVGRAREGRCAYALTSALLLAVTPSSSDTTVSGSLHRHNVRECDAQDSGGTCAHISNIGKFIEDVESEMRSEMDSLYIQKTRTVVEMIRKDSRGVVTQGEEHTKVLNEAVLAMAMSRKASVSDDN